MKGDVGSTEKDLACSLRSAEMRLTPLNDSIIEERADV